MVDAVGIDHVGIGTDTDLLSSPEGQGTNTAYPGLTGEFLHAVVGEMRCRLHGRRYRQSRRRKLLPRLWQGYGWPRLSGTEVT